jgi:membrane protein implicated in regulation of membrane protease activity
MDVSAATLWWMAAGLLVVAELLTGTFYLLMLALGGAAGALAAWSGAQATTQVVVAAAVAAGTTALWHLRRRREPRSAPAEANHDVMLDIGERVQVAEWAADGCARVRYRGTDWTAHLAPGANRQAGAHVVSAVQGNWLVLTPAAD